MKRVLAAAAMLAIAAGAVQAQMGGGKQQPTPLELQYERERREQQDNERAYNEQMKRLKMQNPTDVKTDPWAGVRPANEGAAKR
jgi:hypothetical protein